MTKIPLQGLVACLSRLGPPSGGGRLLWPIEGEVKVVFEVETDAQGRKGWVLYVDSGEVAEDGVPGGNGSQGTHADPV